MCRNTILCSVAMVLFLASANSTRAAAPATDASKDDYTVAVYYFPNYHVDPRNEKQHGKGWTEWELVKRAEPRFKDHQQPKVPLWGYTDEADPVAMAQKIDAAASHGVDVFIYDWYYYDDGPFIERGLERGFLKAANNSRMKFSIMWANHDWTDIHPAKPRYAPLQFPGKVTSATFEKMTDHIINVYFKHPSYWKIDGRPYFSVYELFQLIDGFGGVEETAKALRRFREKTKAAGFPDLHLNAVEAGIRILPNEKQIKDPPELIKRLGFDSVTAYVWVHHVGLPQFPETPYTFVMDHAAKHWGEAAKRFSVPYYPNVSMGWDPSPRTIAADRYENQGYPYMTTISGNTPEAFKTALTRVKAFLDQRKDGPKILTINAWNEWTEGSYLEPDTVNKMAYLEAIRDVFR